MSRTSLVLLLVSAALAACSPNETPVPVKTGELGQLTWPIDEASVVRAWETEQSDLKALQRMLVDADFLHVALFGDILDIRSNEDKSVAVEDLTNSDEWIALMNRASVGIISRKFGITTVIVKAPRTAKDTTLYANYIYHHPLPAMQCKEQYRSASCGICDMTLDDEWSLRLTWSTGEFEVEWSENRFKSESDNESSLSIEEIRSRYEESKDACMKSGLAEMGYKDPDLYYPFGS